MKKLLVPVAILAILLASCAPAAKKTDGAATGSTDKTAQEKPAKAPSKTDVSYAFGRLIGESLKGTYVDMDYAAFTRGVREAVENKSKLEMETANERVQTAITAAMEKRSTSNLEVEKKFLEKNKTQKGVVATGSGLQYQVLVEGTGPKPVSTDTVKVNYVGTTTAGVEFDSSIKRNEPAVFPLDGVIPGWTEGIQLMPVGSKFKFWIPSSLAYGDRSPTPAIEPNSTLVFEVELLSIETPPAPAPTGKK